MWLRLLGAIALVVCMPGSTQADELSLRRMEQQFEELDYRAAIATGRSLLGAGGNRPATLKRIYERLGRALIITDDAQGASLFLRKLLALQPGYQAGEEVSPKLRRVIADVIQKWAGRPGLTVVHRPPGRAPCDRPLQLAITIVEDPEKMAHRIRLTYWLPAATSPRGLEVQARQPDNVLTVPMSRCQRPPGSLRYAAQLLDQQGNVVFEAGWPAALSVRLHRSELASAPTPAVAGPALDLGAQVKQQDELARRGRRARTLWGYSALGLGLASSVAAAVLYSVGAAQGGAAHESYRRATTDQEISRYGHDVDVAKRELTAGHALVGIAVAAVATSIYLLVTRPRLRGARLEGPR